MVLVVYVYIGMSWWGVGGNSYYPEACTTVMNPLIVVGSTTRRPLVNLALILKVI